MKLKEMDVRIRSFWLGELLESEIARGLVARLGGRAQKPAAKQARWKGKT